MTSFLPSSLCLHPVLQTSGSSFQTLSHFSVFLPCSRTSCHNHPFHTSHLIIFVPFLCHSQAYPSLAPFPFPVPPQKPPPPPCCLLSAALSAHLHPQLPTALPTSQVAFQAHVHPSHLQALQKGVEPPEEVCPFRERSTCPRSPSMTVRASRRGEVPEIGASLQSEELGSRGNGFLSPGLESPAGPPTLPAYQPLFLESQRYPLQNAVQLLLFVSLPNLCNTFVRCRFQIAERFIRPQ